MNRILLVFLLLALRGLAAYTEFYCDPSGDNLNAGSTTSTSAAYTYAGGTFVRSTGVFTVASGNPASDGVAVGDFASIYTTSGATVATFVARVTARDATTITVSLTAIAGAASSVSESAAASTCKVGGAWAGPNGAVSFPFGFVAGTLTNASSHQPRTNFKTGTAYSVSSAMTSGTAGPMRFEGYTTTPGDGGIATIDGGTGAAYTLLTVAGVDQFFAYLRFYRNGTTGGGSPTQGVTTTANRAMFYRCVMDSMRAAGWYIASAQTYLIECEGINCNGANVAGRSAFYLAFSGTILWRCDSHDSAGSNAHGFELDQTVIAYGCRAWNNGGAGFYSQADQYNTLANCDAYNNGSHGYYSASAGATLKLFIENCNFFNNGGYGISANNLSHEGLIFNCAFGSGTAANTSGEIISGLGPVLIQGSVTYPANQTPWTDPANGDFSINHTAGKNTGHASWLRYGGGAGLIGYPDIGSTQHLDTGGGILGFWF